MHYGMYGPSKLKVATEFVIECDVLIAKHMSRDTIDPQTDLAILRVQILHPFIAYSDMLSRNAASDTALIQVLLIMGMASISVVFTILLLAFKDSFAIRTHNLSVPLRP